MAGYVRKPLVMPTPNKDKQFNDLIEMTRNV